MPSVSRRLLLLLLTSVALVLVTVSYHGVHAAVARPTSTQRGPSTTVSADDDDDDDEEDDDDAWDFLSDEAVVAAVDAQRRAVPCAASLPASFLNDDYCDCADGSDEPDTNACALATHADVVFTCKSAASGGQRVASWAVRDGVCDCCDGSDEPAGVCGDTCAQRRHARLATLRSRQRVLTRARATRATFAAMAETRVPELHAQFDEIVGPLTALQRAFQYKQQQLETQEEETSEQPTTRQLYELRSMYAQLNQWQYKAYVHRKLIAEATFDPSRGREAYAALVGECFPFTVNEKQLKGGSSNVIPREYVIVFCPFQNITQTEPGYAKWQRAERESKTGVRENIDDQEEQPTQPPITMGVWDQWVAAEAGDGDGVETDSVVARQRFDHGEPCANGEERVVNVALLCGATSRVVAVEEPEMCMYALQFETPAACTADHEVAVTTAIRLVEGLTEEEGTRDAHIHEEL